MISTARSISGIITLILCFMSPLGVANVVYRSDPALPGVIWEVRTEIYRPYRCGLEARVVNKIERAFTSIQIEHSSSNINIKTTNTLKGLLDNNIFAQCEEDPTPLFPVFPEEISSPERLGEAFPFPEGGAGPNPWNDPWAGTEASVVSDNCTAYKAEYSDEEGETSQQVVGVIWNINPWFKQAWMRITTTGESIFYLIENTYRSYDDLQQVDLMLERIQLVEKYPVGTPVTVTDPKTNLTQSAVYVGSIRTFTSDGPMTTIPEFPVFRSKDDNTRLVPIFLIPNARGNIVLTGDACTWKVEE